MTTARKFDAIGKEEFEAVLGLLHRQIRKNTGIDLQTIHSKTANVIADLPHEYGKLDAADRSWELLIGYLYGKYLKELGVL
jgi:hypothetical protein